MDGIPVKTDAREGEKPTKGAKTLIEYAYQRLRKDIISGVLAPGSKLRIEHLRATYQVGASTLREALTLLLADALVTAEGQRGFWVAPISIDDLKDITRMRKMMATLALRESIDKGDDTWESGIVAAFHRLTRVEDRLAAEAAQVADDWEDRNREFHEAIIGACASRWVRHFRAVLYSQSERYRRFALVATDGGRHVHAEHQAIMEATLDRNADLACQLTEEHIDKTLVATTRMLDIPQATTR